MLILSERQDVAFVQGSAGKDVSPAPDHSGVRLSKNNAVSLADGVPSTEEAEDFCNRGSCSDTSTPTPAKTSRTVASGSGAIAGSSGTCDFVDKVSNDTVAINRRGRPKGSLDKAQRTCHTDQMTYACAVEASARSAVKPDAKLAIASAVPLPSGSKLSRESSSSDSGRQGTMELERAKWGCCLPQPGAYPPAWQTGQEEDELTGGGTAPQPGAGRAGGDADPWTTQLSGPSFADVLAAAVLADLGSANARSGGKPGAVESRGTSKLAGRPADAPGIAIVARSEDSAAPLGEEAAANNIIPTAKKSKLIKNGGKASKGRRTVGLVQRGE